MIQYLPEFYSVSEEVRTALADGKPIVGLESSVVTGGKWPANFETAKLVEATLREGGAVPARIAIQDGVVKVGVPEEELEELANAGLKGKASTRDIAFAVATNKSVGTTVSSSLVVCSQVGIPVFSVAGIGGVHFGATESFDISTDLTQFSRSRIAVVCAGAKSMLDPKLTLEVLETLGVPVVSYKWDFFPGYFTQSTSELSPLRLDDMDQLSKLVKAHWHLPDTGAVLITHPIPKEHSIDEDRLNPLIQQAIQACKRDGIVGQDVTPAILKIISEATEGKSDLINRAVLVSTAKIAAEAAVAIAQSGGENE